MFPPDVDLIMVCANSVIAAKRDIRVPSRMATLQYGFQVRILSCP
jgi:hypothetical protein